MKNSVLKLALMGLAVGSVMSGCSNTGDIDAGSEKSKCNNKSDCKNKSSCSGNSGCSTSANVQSEPSLDLKAKRELAAKELAKDTNPEKI